ncbi:Protein CBG02776 [Caenorhabditis briggsae]|uniref:Protein CBG02776 n=1 Tax=Caenorhabditis briggsae TaxID=6238 RepID=A8WTJ0_CAEBR|nr:Protein CBG02776 [Caenorhabditis briggsae]CAP23802.2 Protein CBG02776 [Caenorhabditis briggsae]
MNFVLLIFFLFTTKCSSLKIKSEIDVTKYGLTQQEILKSPHYKDKVFNIPMNTESGEELLEHWAVQGFSGVVAAIATRRLSLVEEYQKKDHEKCSSEAETLAEHAKCLIQLEDYAHRNRLIHRKRLFVRKMRRRIDKMETRTTMAPITAEEIKKEKEWVGSFRFRAKREIKVHTRDSYTLKSHKEMSPFGLVTKHLTSAVKLLKHTDKVSKWQDTIERIAKKADVIKEQKKMEDFMQRRLSVFTDAAAKMKQNKKLAKDDSLKEMNDLEEFIDNDQIRDVLRNRKEKITEQDKLLMIPMKMMRDAAKMSLGMTGYNTTDFDRKIVRIISPRIMSVIPQEEEAKNNEIDVLSPSLFALHDDGSGVEKKASLGNLLGSLTNNKDSQDFLDFIVEATGVNEAMERVEKKIGEYRRLKDDAMGRGPEGQPLYFTKENVTEKYPHEAKKIDMFEALDKTYSDEQLKEMNRTGYTIMRHDQMDLIYGKGSVGENEKFLKTAKALSRPQIDRAIMSTIKDLAHEKVKFEARRNDIVLSPITFSNFILDPVVIRIPTNHPLSSHAVLPYPLPSYLRSHDHVSLADGPCHYLPASSLSCSSESILNGSHYHLSSCLQSVHSLSRIHEPFRPFSASFHSIHSLSTSSYSIDSDTFLSGSNYSESIGFESSGTFSIRFISNYSISSICHCSRFIPICSESK